MDFQAFMCPAFIQPQQIGAGSNVGHQRHDEFLADRVNGRVGDLGEALLEIIVEQTRAVGEHGQRGINPHRADWLLTGQRHRL